MIYATVDEAAMKLSMTPGALRRRLERYARRVGRDIMVQLGDGIVAFKIGRLWRVKFPC